MDDSIHTDYIETHEHLKHTFEVSEICEWVEQRLQGRVLNACAGYSRLSHDREIVRNDINTDVPADSHMDAAALAGEFAPSSFDTILFDPPWSMYQANMRYDGHHVTKGDTELDISQLPQDIQSDKSQVGHARLAKDGFDYLLKPGGVVIQLSYNGTCMPSRLGYDRLDRVMIDPLGEGKTLIASRDRKVQRKFTD